MRFLKPVNVLAAANMLSLAYLVSELIAFIRFESKGPDQVVLPFGFWLPEAHLTLHVQVFRSNNRIYTFWTVLICIASGLVSGWITGALCALVYNPVARSLGAKDWESSPLPSSALPPD
jgi:hypothetical protein